MAEYIDREAAICIADYAVDEHPYDKNPEKPETFSDYNQGWHDACDYIQVRLENVEKADVAEVRHARWDENGRCTGCGEHAPYYGMASAYHASPYCFGCGARMDLGGADNG